ncbi:MAG: methylenetetrahydrofolate--tRNA-(uracil(54)-C(5))-methyltransferase (FADH(2)-oxidizing) TrmFO [Gemmatimonadetes bacterium]|nr:methylenetetrahydrofolate--tRNA-(uracil(54)-C(5))-methyltransferase (FADH(2)-oxidizing) TrmFO [Gemmatimonadota bacterium]
MAEARVTVVGAGLAGCESALQLASRGREVRLLEMRPGRATPAHQTGGLGELVCTNSFKSEDPATAHGQLKWEMAALGSVLLSSAEEARVPAGQALAVDRHVFSSAMTRAVEGHPRIELVREEAMGVPDPPVIVATGPLTSDALSEAIQRELGDGGLSFFDAIAPIVDGDSLDREILFAQGRFEQAPDYLNCPFSKDEYQTFVRAIAEADVHEGGHDWDRVPYFEGCLPVEVLAARGVDTLRFGPMKPLGLEDPRTGRRPYAVVQLRREDRAGQMWNLVGFQTRLRIAEQTRVFRTIPGLAQAEFLRHGAIHRNSYLNFPARLSSHGSMRGRADMIFAGQLTGVEGYTESAASGILAGVNLDRVLSGLDPVVPPPTTMLGALYRYLSEADPKHFQPMNSNWGLVEPPDDPVRDKKLKRELLAARARRDFANWMQGAGIDRAGADRVEPSAKRAHAGGDPRAADLDAADMEAEGVVP